MNGPIFKSVLNTPMAMNSAEEKGSEGQMPTEKSAHLFSMRISLTCQRIYNSNKIKQYQPRQLRINIELRQHKGKRKVTLELLLFGHLIQQCFLANKTKSETSQHYGLSVFVCLETIGNLVYGGLNVREFIPHKILKWPPTLTEQLNQVRASSWSFPQASSLQ